MKNFKILLLYSLLLMLFTTGCDKKTLDITPTDKITTSDYYKTITDATEASTDAYAPLKQNGLYRMWFGMTDMMSDNAVVSWSAGDGAEAYELKEGRATSQNPIIRGVWNSSYSGIARANAVITYVGAMKTIDQSVVKQNVGQGQFLRALYYFNLVRCYGDVPLRLKPLENLDLTNTALPKTPRADVYKQIIQDLKDAASNLPLTWTGSDIGRATKGAALGLLSKVYLTLATRTDAPLNAVFPATDAYANAATYAKQVIDLVPSVYDLLPKYGDIFKQDGSYSNCKESLFEVQMSMVGSYGDGGQQTIYWGPRFFAICAGGWGFSQPTSEFVGSYESGDLRKVPTVFYPADTSYLKDDGMYFHYDPVAYQSRTGYNTRKYVTTFKHQWWENAAMNIHILRLSDIYLVYAEAKLATGDVPSALLYTNLVRTRAGLPTLATINQAAIWKERRMELAFENDRYFDLLRTNRFISVMNTQLTADFSSKINLSTKNIFWPIPKVELDSNPNMVQNYGY